MASLNVVVWKRTEHFASVRQILYKNQVRTDAKYSVLSRKIHTDCHKSKFTKAEQMRNILSFPGFQLFFKFASKGLQLYCKAFPNL